MNIDEFETNIEAGLSGASSALYEVGKSLACIRDGKLYKKAGFPSFEVYLRERWDFNRTHGYHLIHAAEVLEGLREHFEEAQLPQTESAIRPLRALTQEKRIEVWNEALKRSRRRPGKGTVDAVIAELCAWSACDRTFPNAASVIESRVVEYRSFAEDMPRKLLMGRCVAYPFGLLGGALSAID